MSDAHADELVLVEDRGPVRILTLNRPDKLNALNTALTQALVDTFDAADADESVRAIVLAGASRWSPPRRGRRWAAAPGSPSAAT